VGINSVRINQITRLKGEKMCRTEKADKAFTFNDMVNRLRSLVRKFPDRRIGKKPYLGIKNK